MYPDTDNKRFSFVLPTPGDSTNINYNIFLPRKFFLNFFRRGFRERDSFPPKSCKSLRKHLVIVRENDIYHSAIFFNYFEFFPLYTCR